jgi:hypothetical protein
MTSKQQEVILYALDNMLINGKVSRQPEVYEQLLADFSECSADVSKYLNRLDSYLEQYTPEEIRFYYLNRRTEKDHVKTVIRQMSNNKSSNKSNNFKKQPSNSKAITNKTPLTKEELEKVRKLINTRSNNQSSNESNKRAIILKNNRKKHTINLEIDLVEQAKKKAAKINISLSEYINQIIYKDLK